MGLIKICEKVKRDVVILMLSGFVLEKCLRVMFSTVIY